MLADSVFLQGSTHRVCEDYANHDSGGLALVADGCSSAIDSDVAARLAWLGLRQSWRGLAGAAGAAGDRPRGRDSGMTGDSAAGMVPGAFGRMAGSGPGPAGSTGRALGPGQILDPGRLLAADLEAMAAGSLGEALFATTLTARLIGGRLWVTAVGDGGILLRLRDGRSRWYHLGYPAWNAPLYWTYLLDPEAGEQWEAGFPGNRLEIATVDFAPGAGGGGLTGGLATGGQASYSATVPAALPDAAGAIQASPAGLAWFCLDLDPAVVDYALLCSDGIESFVGPDGAPVPDLDILGGLTAFPNRSGEFLQRRVRRLMADLADSGIRHRDDFAAAILVMD